MYSNYHTHTFRCKHAKGSEEEYIEKAISEGVKILGFSDHAPYIYPPGYVSSYKMLPEQLSEYCDTLSALKEKYRDKIEIHIGLETEYYENLFDETLEFWRGYPIEYLILGHHMLGNEYDKTRWVVGTRTEDKSILTRYVDAVLKAAGTGRISCVAHPDMLNFVGDEDFYLQENERMLKGLKQLSVPVEINLLGLMDKRHYPRERFWELAGRCSIDAILGFDAHTPECCPHIETVVEGMRLADRYGINLLSKLELKNPLF